MSDKQYPSAQFLNAVIVDDDFCKAVPAEIVRCMARELSEIRASLKRRDSQEPVADVVLWEHPTEERKCDIRWRRHDVQPGPLYAAATAAVLPPAQSASNAPMRGHNPDGAYCWAIGANWMRQPEKVVKLPTVRNRFGPKGSVYLNEVMEALDTAGVKWVEGE